jgi:branched-chain amino acid aminotransferase
MAIDWGRLGFQFMNTRCHIRYTWRNGEWGEEVMEESPYLPIHIAATCLHYGQAAFEGLKAFTTRDGAIKLFRVEDHSRRFAVTARRVLMPEVPTELFVDAIRKVVKANEDYVPPYGTNGALYIRPLLIGTGPRIGVQPAEEFTFLIYVTPVGDYYASGLSPVSALVVDGHDRAAPQGVGNVKVAGNYAAGMMASKIAAEQGYPINLFLDARENKYVEEFGTSNFIAITEDNRYVTPKADSILRSITNDTLMTLAEEEGMTVERRQIPWEELSSFSEIGACGTAVIITPVNRIVRGEQVVEAGPREGVGPVLQRLYERVRGIQKGEVEDRWGWMTTV